MRSLTLRPKKLGLDRDIDSFFSDFFNAPMLWSDSGNFYPAVDIQETENDIMMSFEIPGMEKENIKVSIENDILTISGDRNLRHEEKDDNYIRTEIRSGSFCRSFSLPKGVDSRKIEASYKNGILKVKLLKAEEAKPKQIEVKVS